MKTYITGLINKQKGFTLVELIVTITVFLIIFETVIGIFIAGIRQQRISLETQLLLDQITFSLEFMSRNLRMANKELNNPPDCLSSRGLNYEITHNGNGVKFINTLDNNECQEFFLDNDGRLRYKKGNQPDQDALPMTSSKLTVSSLKFNLMGGDQSDEIQPRLTFVLEISSKSPNIPKTKFQTTVSQRKLDVQY
jgi:prepilin-type N-terminal cleavage/methylation domain-containing protein